MNAPARHHKALEMNPTLFRHIPCLDFYCLSRLVDQDKDCLIIDRINNGQWSWNWSRTNLGVRNLAYLCDMLNEIGQLNIDVNEDTCTWSLGPNGTFTVKDARYRIDQNIPHRLNLSSRGMDIPAISCPSCNDNVESKLIWVFLLIYEYNARVYVKSKLRYFPLLKDRLGLDCCVLFRETYFWWLDLTYVENEESLIHYMLQKQKISDNDHYDLPLIYSVNGHTLHFGHREFCLISRFKLGFLSFRKFREGDITFRNRVFPEKIGKYLKNIDLLSLVEDEYRFSSLSDPDSIRVCLLLSLKVIFMGHELGSAVDDVFLRMVEDLDVWNDFPWGVHMWRELYGAITNVNLNHQQRHHKDLEMNPNFVPTYSLSGFLLSFKIWILESSCVTDRWWCKRSEEIPRGCSWSKHFPFQNWENYGKLFPEKDGDVESGCQTSTKEVSLKDRVKAMEGLCTSLMILPKEIKSLKARIYKLETIINSGKDGEFFSFNVSPHQSANKDPVNELVDADRPPVEEDTYVKVLSIDTLKKQNNVLDQYMIEKCQQLKPWGEEDLTRPFNCIDKVYCNFVLEQFLIKSSWRHCKFPWCNDISVDGRFWDALIGLDDKRLGWLLDDHIELWVWYMWHFRQSCHDWSIVSCYFLTLLLQDSMPFFYVTDEIYPMAWRDVEQVFIHINKPKRHWSLAQFHIQSRNVTFYESQKIEGVEYRSVETQDGVV
ncbi:phospholipase-like, aminotransferase-like mobile domain protein [Tanacetum coccineum]